ncbi:MAG: MarR family winged helix-turn-helix transcriptional regulator [Methyloligellaceae bacterium]
MTGEDKSETPERLEPDKRFRVLNWIGIIEQLSSTRANQLLKDSDLPMPQFIMLNHFSHRPNEGKTVTGIAAAFQHPQPGVTKTVQKLIRKGFLRSRPSPTDGRAKLLYLTSAGTAAHRSAVESFQPHVVDIFRNWQSEEIEELFRLLDRLKIQLDENR